MTVFCFQTFGQTKMELSNKQIVKTVTISQPLDTVWSWWTTHEGLKTFFGSDNRIELIPGGAFEIYFILDNPVGQRGSESCKVLSFLPKKYFSFSWNAPPQFDEIRRSDHKTWVIIEFNPVSNNQTEITLTHMGWPKDEKWTPAFDYFNEAWETVMNRLSQKSQKTTTPFRSKKVTGIGGIFFKCKDPQKMKEWYNIHLGLNTDKYGTTFEWRQSADMTKKGFTQWSPFSDKTKYFEPSTKDFMINYRVENLKTIVEQLKKDGVTIADTIETFE